MVGQLDDIVGQPFFIGSTLRSLALRGPVLTKCAASAALGYAKFLPHMIDAARRGITASVLGDHGDETDPVASWDVANEARIKRTRERIQSLLESGDLTVSRMTVAAGLMGDLAGA